MHILLRNGLLHHVAGLHIWPRHIHLAAFRRHDLRTKRASWQSNYDTICLVDGHRGHTAAFTHFHVDALTVDDLTGRHRHVEHHSDPLAAVHDDALALASNLDRGSDAAEDVHLRSDKHSMCLAIKIRLRTVSRLSPMMTSAGPVWHSTSHLELSAWKSSLGGPFTVSATRAVGAFLTTTGAGEVSLNSERQVCMSLVTVFRPAVMAPPLLRAPKRSALGACEAGLTLLTAVAAVSTTAGVAAAVVRSSGLYWVTSRPFLVLFQATPVVW